MPLNSHLCFLPKNIQSKKKVKISSSHHYLFPRRMQIVNMKIHLGEPMEEALLSTIHLLKNLNMMHSVDPRKDANDGEIFLIPVLYYDTSVHVWEI